MISWAQRTLLILCLMCCLGFCGCGGGSAKKEEPKIPLLALADVNAIPEYPQTDRDWNTSAVCWVDISDHARWKWKLPHVSSEARRWVNANTSQVLKALIGAELQREGYTVEDYGYEYVTRQKRLALQKLVFFEGFEITGIRVQEGQCFDMKLTIRIVNNPEYDEGVLCEIWGRSLLEGDEKRPWPEIYQDCVRNMANIPEVRDALLLTTSSPTTGSLVSSP